MEIVMGIGSEAETKTKKFFAELREGSDNMPATKKATKKIEETLVATPEASKPRAQAKTKKVTKTTKAKGPKANTVRFTPQTLEAMSAMVDTNVVEEMLEGGAETPTENAEAVQKVEVRSGRAKREVENAKVEAAKVFTPTVVNAKRPKGAANAILRAIQKLPNGMNAVMEIHMSNETKLPSGLGVQNTEYDIIWEDGPVDWPTIACGGGDVTAHKPYDANNMPTFATLLGNQMNNEHWYCEPLTTKTLSVIWDVSDLRPEARY